jgi:excisionase family DNA binding protein
MSVRLTGWQEICEYTGISVTTIRKWAKRGGFPIMTIGKDKYRKVFTFTGLVDKWLLKNKSVYPENYQHL